MPRPQHIHDGGAGAAGNIHIRGEIAVLSSCCWATSCRALRALAMGLALYMPPQENRGPGMAHC